jgi:hypothetical protein
VARGGPAHPRRLPVRLATAGAFSRCYMTDPYAFLSRPASRPPCCGSPGL